MTTTSKAVIYARKSTESEDRQVLSIDSQVKELQAFADKQSLTISEVLTESKSAKGPGRPIFDELFRRVQRREFDTIVCWKLDRLARNPLDGGALIWALDQGQLQQIVTPSSSYRNSGSDKFLMQLEFGMAKKYVDDLSDNVRRGMRAKTESGWFPHLAPFGYLNDKARRTIIKDPKRFMMVRRMWDMMLTGNYTPSQIASIATEQWGVKSRKKHDTASKGLSRSAVYNLFSNPFYYGLIVRADQSVVGKHPPMVTKQEFDRVQNLLGRVDRPRAKRHSFTYAGLFKCGNCGCSITAEEKQKTLKTTRQTARYVYYHCSRRKPGVICREPAITEKALEAQLIRFFVSIKLPAPYTKWVVQCLKELEEEEHEKDRTTQLSTEKRLAQIDSELSALLDLRLKGIVSDVEYVDKKRALEGEQLTLHTSNTRERDVNVTALFERILSLSQGAVEAIEKGDPSAKRSVVSAVCSNRTLLAGKLAIQAQKPLSFLTFGKTVGNADTGRLEPAINGYGKRRSGDAKLHNPAWWARLNDVRTWVREHLEELSGIDDLVASNIQDGK